MALRMIGSSPHGRGTLVQVPREAPRPSVHPRTGGEHNLWPGGRLFSVGSSPHGRGTRRSLQVADPAARFIPARAGNTGPRRIRCLRRSVHPRTGGEHTTQPCLAATESGSSPHGRGTRRDRARHARRRRFIPARAGNTPTRGMTGTSWPVHPRTGGEHSASGRCS